MLVRDKTKGARMNRRQYSTWTVYGPVCVCIYHGQTIRKNSVRSIGIYPFVSFILSL